MEDPVRKVGGGGTAGGDRWEGEDEDEDVKVGAGRGSGQRGSGLALSRAGMPANGRAGGLWAQGRRPGLRALGPDASVGFPGALLSSARRPYGPESSGVAFWTHWRERWLPRPQPYFKGLHPGLDPTRQLATGGDSRGRARSTCKLHGLEALAKRIWEVGD